MHCVHVPCVWCFHSLSELTTNLLCALLFLHPCLPLLQAEVLWLMAAKEKWLAGEGGKLRQQQQLEQYVGGKVVTIRNTSQFSTHNPHRHHMSVCLP